jgi:hypothetical protein
MFRSKKKLNLNKETVRALSGTEMLGLVGGAFNGAIVAHCSDHCCTKSCNTCGCTKLDFGAAVVLPAYRL